MKAKDKVLKLRPNAKCEVHSATRVPINKRSKKTPPKYYSIFDGMHRLCPAQCREDWAWADTYRNLTNKH